MCVYVQCNKYETRSNTIAWILKRKEALEIEISIKCLYEFNYLLIWENFVFSDISVEVEIIVWISISAMHEQFGADPKSQSVQTLI